MKRSLFTSAIVLAVAIALSFLWVGAGAVKAPSSKNRPSTPLILVSVDPYVKMITKIAGDLVKPIAVIPPGVDPHHWEPNYSEMDRLQDASIWFISGMAFEPGLKQKLLQTNPNLIICDLNASVPKLEPCCDAHDHEEESFDTHTWLSPQIDIIQNEIIAKALIDLLPESKDLFEKNCRYQQQRLKLLDQKIKNALAPYKGGLLVTTHGAYSYYCEAYDLKQLVLEPEEGKEPKIREISEMLDLLRKEKSQIVGIFTQPQHSNKAAKIIAQDLGLKTYMVDPYDLRYTATIKRLTAIISKSEPSGDET